MRDDGAMRLRRGFDLRNLIETMPPWARRAGTILLILLAVCLVLGGTGYAMLSRGLPSARQLESYEPPLPTQVRAIDGTPLKSFARERRVFVPYPDIPPMLVEAMISAEDKTFFSHGGLDYLGILSAIWTNILSDKRPVGASTITQQVAKNLLLNNEVSYLRKAREAILARRIENSFTKEQILELYLNQIFLGRNAYGVEAAAQAYFGKSVGQLTLPEAAYLAILPKAPSNYNPVTRRERALARRDYVLNQMAANGYITGDDRDAARAAPLVAIRAIDRTVDHMGDYFFEDVRRQLIAKFGEAAEQGPNSVYAGGLWVRSTINPVMQRAAERALRDALVSYDRGRGWRGVKDRIKLGTGWEDRLKALNLPLGYPEWRAAVVMSNTQGEMRIGFTDGTQGAMGRDGAAFLRAGAPGAEAWRYLKPGDVVPVQRLSATRYAIRQIPDISGGMIVQDPHTGRILAMVGGFDARRSQFNRATQAKRQPGSAFKPFVYATALDNGYTPASIVVDAPYCVFQTKLLGTKCFKNFTGGYAGPQTMRWGVEQSRNLMTVRTAYNVGMDKVVKTARDMGVGDYPSVLAISLGAGDTTVERLTNAYSMLANGGKRVEPLLIDLVQDRHGKAIFRADSRACEGCNADDWRGEAMPRPADTRKQAMDPATAYQMVHIMEGVVLRGTAEILRDLNRPLFGKTGTTNGPTNGWFGGGTPDRVAGIYLGYDQPSPLGGWAQGGRIAAPVFKQFALATLKDAPKLPFRIPPGIRMVRVDRRSGKPVFDAFPTDPYEYRPAVIWEAFKPASEPRRSARADTGFETKGAVKSDSDFLRNSGGIY